MTIRPELLMAILAMDSYNRGYDRKLVVSGSVIADASLSTSLGDVSAGIFAQSYQLANGNTVISYRGTDVLPNYDNSFDLRDIAAWSIWFDANYNAAQARLAAQFYQQIAATGVGAGENAIITTGHSLGGALAGFVAGIYGLPAKIFDNIEITVTVHSIDICGSGNYGDKIAVTVHSIDIWNYGDSALN